MDTKKLAFEYFLCELMKWDMEARHLEDFNTNNDLSILKSLKLLFFTVAIDAKNNNPLLNIFNNFHAMPLGHVELDVYNQYSDLTYFSLDRYSLKLKNISWDDVQKSLNSNTEELSMIQKGKIKNAVLELKKKKIHINIGESI
ncbi:hypothetical protein [Chryseobacterium proteolyticum]|uniref:hypothetical protein n=1 Tax=Chryseobacterium proteolyticum TaxID=118127 RepID=UPI00398377B3